MRICLLKLFKVRLIGAHGREIVYIYIYIKAYYLYWLCCVPSQRITFAYAERDTQTFSVVLRLVNTACVHPIVDALRMFRVAITHSQIFWFLSIAFTGMHECRV